MSSKTQSDWVWSAEEDVWEYVYPESESDRLLGPADAAQAAVATGRVPKGTPFLVAGLGAMGYAYGGQRFTYLLTDDGLYTKVGEA